MADRAFTLDDRQLSALLKNIADNSKAPLEDTVAFLLSFKAGLRVQEIAGLEWSRHLLGPDGTFFQQEFYVPGKGGRMVSEFHPILQVSSDIGKYGKERTVRVHPALFSALKSLHAVNKTKHVIPSRRKTAGQDLDSRASALKIRINRYYKAAGYEGCSSHSGRRTFITKAARVASLHNCSLADVQYLCGHQNLSSTQCYIDLSPSQSSLVAYL